MDQENHSLKLNFENREIEIKKLRDSEKDKFELERKLNEKVLECSDYLNQFKVTHYFFKK